MNIQDKKQDFEKVIEHISQDIAGVRTNRAAPALIENIKVDIYGSKMQINQVASISCPELKQLLVEPWDKNVLKDIEKAIETASLGLSVKNEGNFLRLFIPAMTEETRKEIIKILREKLENGRVSLRGLRDKIKEEIITAERSKEIGEDEKYNLIEDLDKMTREYNEEIVELGEKKEKEITL
ncbi:ribosome recycling factor [Patescibacteria group bacterium]|nr:ribosome recycling factor [Patescibacteria group bacterium]